VSADVLEQTAKRPWCPLVSYTTNLDRLREVLLDAPSARARFLSVWEAGRRKEPLAARLFRFGRNRRRRDPRPERPRRIQIDPFDDEYSNLPLEDQPPEAFRTPAALRYPWQWSAYVLAGLFVASAWTLSTRVKSMDRLR
jgi:hypothetical protein